MATRTGAAALRQSFQPADSAHRVGFGTSAARARRLFRPGAERSGVAGELRAALSRKQVQSGGAFLFSLGCIRFFFISDRFRFCILIKKKTHTHAHTSAVRSSILPKLSFCNLRACDKSIECATGCISTSGRTHIFTGGLMYRVSSLRVWFWLFRAFSSVRFCRRFELALFFSP